MSQKTAKSGPDTVSEKSVVDGHTLSDMIISGANALDNDKNAINDLNVFPVPDGDTGINMSLTLSDSAKELSGFSGNVSECAEKTASTSLRSARGNSGAILSLFFRGMAKSLRGRETATSKDMAEAFESGTKEAYKAVSNPTEGTILTVMRVCSEEAKTNSEKEEKKTIGAFFAHVVHTAEETLAKTPEMLTVLKQAKVVDAGGSGFVTMLKGMYAALMGKPVERENTDAGTKMSAAARADGSDTAIRFAYCTECIVEKSADQKGEGTAEAFRSYLLRLGDSLVFVDDEEIIKLHVHTNHPGKVMENALKYGQLVMVKVENMRLQHSELVGAGASEKNDSPAPAAEEAVVTVAAAEKKYGFVAVCMGKGISDAFTDLGTDQLIFGGQTMNPSTQDILDAINRTPSEIVFILPNNKNICMVAQQAAKLSTEKKAIVIPTVSIPQGMAVLMNFDPEADTEQLVTNMTDAIAAVTSMAVTFAVRDTEIDNTKIRKGQSLGMINGKIRVVSDDALECLRLMTAEMRDAQFVTVFCGEEINEHIRQDVSDILREKLKGADINVLPGGQPLYDFIISVE